MAVAAVVGEEDDFACDGTRVGEADGTIEGALLGRIFEVGLDDGVYVGAFKGEADGIVAGAIVGEIFEIGLVDGV